MVAVLTPDAPDVLSHVSVRARNMRVLFATCHDAKPLDEIKVRGGGLRCWGPGRPSRLSSGALGQLQCTFQGAATLS